MATGRAGSRGAWGRATGFPARANTLRRSAYDTFRSRYGVPTDAAGRGFALRGLTTGNVAHDEYLAGAEGDENALSSPTPTASAAAAQGVEGSSDAAVLGAASLANSARDAASSTRAGPSRGAAAGTAAPVLPVNTGGMVPATPNTISTLRVDTRASQTPEIGATDSVVAHRIGAAVQTAGSAAVQDAIDIMWDPVHKTNAAAGRTDAQDAKAAAEAAVDAGAGQRLAGQVAPGGEQSVEAVAGWEHRRPSRGARSSHHTELPPYPFYYGVPGSAASVSSAGTTHSSDVAASAQDFLPDVSNDPDYALQVAQVQARAQAQAQARAQARARARTSAPAVRAPAARQRQRGPPRSERGVWGFMSGWAVSESRAAAAAAEYVRRMRALNESAVQSVLERGQADTEAQACDLEHMTGNERQEYLRHIREIARELHETEQKRKAAEDQEFYEFLRSK